MLKGKGIKILLIICIIFGILSSSKVLATNSNISAYSDYGAEVLDVKWFRTKEPTNSKDYINILDNKEFNSTVISVDEYSPKRTGDEKIFSIENLGEGVHTLTFKLTGKKNERASNTAAHISFSKIYSTLMEYKLMLMKNQLILMHKINLYIAMLGM